MCFSISQEEIALNPHNKVVFEGAFDDLMEKIRREELVDVCMRKVVGEGL
jgi:hypothetical protein